MEKNQFYNLLSNYTSLSADEAGQLILLEKEFPYSQVIHGMAARAANDNALDDKEHQLHLSAIYSTDRNVLKSVMTSQQKPRKEIPQPNPVASEVKEITKTAIQPIKEIASTVVMNEHLVPTMSSNLTGDALLDEVMHDLEILRERKHQFEEAVDRLEKGLPFATTENPKPRKVKAPSDPDEGLLNEIKTSKKKIKPEGPKQKEQIEIIDQFIKTQPNISKNKSVGASASKDDLSESNLTYGENIVSETLVEILIKQGKKEKAIEVLKKLIWKFPQKKAYFAAQIEDLKR